MTNKSDYFYELPQHLIAQQPIARRDASRLMYINRQTGAFSHHTFTDIKSFLRPGDCIVVNDSRVIPARLISDNSVEVLLHEKQVDGQWTALVKPGKKARVGDTLVFAGGRLRAEITALADEGLRVLKMTHDGDFEELLVDIGTMPLPHYIEEEQTDTTRYQTVYAKHDGSVAAPTAGLHFTEELLAEIREMGVHILQVTLHVGMGTFRPVKVDDITAHHMHSEYCRVEPEVAAKINAAKAAGGRIIAIGTTSCRTLESRADAAGNIIPGAGKTDIFIYPGYQFKCIDGLLTNFHLPESTLIMLVSAFAGRENTLAAYEAAVQQQYRFFSYGDAMLLLTPTAAR